MDGRGARRQWSVLAAGLAAMTAGCAFQYGLPYLIPTLRAEGVSLREAAILVACPTAGLLLTLVAWGAAADRFGERVVLSTGAGLAGLALLGGTAAGSTPALGGFLLLAGAAGASVHAASGRLILGWFAARERGLAMGARQTAQPLGVAVAALTLPALGAAGGRAAALGFLGGACLVAAAFVVVAVRDPARPAAAAGMPARSPYHTPMLWRIHAASVLLVVPQFTVATFGVTYLVDRRGLSALAAGRLLAVAQLGAAAARLSAGYWSDRVRSRLRPLRTVALLIAAVMAALAAAAFAGSPAAVAVLLVAAIATASPNGLAFTAVAEHAGQSWAGRALGIQNTGQNVAASATPPVLAQVVSAAGYGLAFASAIVFPLVAAVLVPVRRERAAGLHDAAHRPVGAREGR